MDVVPYLSAVILVATIATLVLAAFSYAAFKLRNSRKPNTPSEIRPMFRRYRPPQAAPAAEAAEEEA